MKNSGFTLIELMVSTAILGIVAMTVYSSFSLGLRSWRSIDEAADCEAQRILSQLTAELRSAYCSSEEEDSRFLFQGNAASVRFTTTAAFGGNLSGTVISDMRKVRYYAAGGADATPRVLWYSAVDALLRRSEIPDAARVLSKHLDSLAFSFYDGKNWIGEWNSSVRLPRAVQVTLALRSKARNASAHTFYGATFIPCGSTPVVLGDK